MDDNRRLRSRQKFNSRFLNSLRDKEIHYVYALIDRATRTVGYIGVTNDPNSRRWQHQNDLWFRKDRNNSWRERFNAKPEMVLLMACPNRVFAEVVESTLIGRYGNGGDMIINYYKYWNPKQAKAKYVEDDLPFLSIGEEDGFMVDWTVALQKP